MFVAAWLIGLAERRRVAGAVDEPVGADAAVSETPDHVPIAAPATSRGLWIFNAVLTLVTLVALVVELLPLPVIFLIACAMALVVNFPDAHEQRDRLTAHGSSRHGDGDNGDGSWRVYGHHDEVRDADRDGCRAWSTSCRRAPFSTSR